MGSDGVPGEDGGATTKASVAVGCETAVTVTPSAADAIIALAASVVKPLLIVATVVASVVATSASTMIEAGRIRREMAEGATPRDVASRVVRNSF